MRSGEYEEIEKQKIYVGVEIRETEEGAEDEKVGGKKARTYTRQEQLQEKGT